MILLIGRLRKKLIPFGSIPKNPMRQNPSRDREGPASAWWIERADQGRSIAARTNYPALRRIRPLRLRCTSNSDSAAGVTPEMRPA